MKYFSSHLFTFLAYSSKFKEKLYLRSKYTNTSMNVYLYLASALNLDVKTVIR